MIMLHRYIVDLLSEYVAGIRDMERNNEPSSIPHKEILFRIKEYILVDPNVTKHELKKLCLKFGLNATGLKRNFKLLFGQSLASFTRMHALTKAYQLITTTELSIDLIADEIGYGYRSNFDKAFKQQFGFLPTKLRK